MQGEQTSKSTRQKTTLTSDLENPVPVPEPIFDVYFINEEMKDVLKAVNDE